MADGVACRGCGRQMTYRADKDTWYHPRGLHAPGCALWLTREEVEFTRPVRCLRCDQPIIGLSIPGGVEYSHAVPPVPSHAVLTPLNRPASDDDVDTIERWLKA